MRKAPRRGLRLAKFQFLLFLLVCFLLPDVIADDLFRQTDGADAVPARPKVVAREVARPPVKGGAKLDHRGGGKLDH